MHTMGRTTRTEVVRSQTAAMHPELFEIIGLDKPITLGGFYDSRCSA